MTVWQRWTGVRERAEGGREGELERSGVWFGKIGGVRKRERESGLKVEGRLDLDRAGKLLLQ